MFGRNHCTRDNVAQALLIRADASPVIGTGHVMRCMAIAQEWQHRGGTAIFASPAWQPALEDRLSKEGFEVVSMRSRPGSPEDALETLHLARELGANWILADGYYFQPAFQKVIAGNDTRLMLVDDNGELGRYDCDIVLNQNYHAGAELYAQRRQDTRLLLGSQYLLLRNEFTDRQPAPRIPPIVSNILVTMGGSDPEHVTERVLQNLVGLDLQGREVRVVTGAANTRREHLPEVARAVGVKIAILHDVRDMPALMDWTELAVAAAGTTSWELAYMGVPAVLVPTVPNQDRITESLAAEGTCWSMPRDKWQTRDLQQTVAKLIADPETRREMSRRGMEIGRASCRERVCHRV